MLQLGRHRLCRLTNPHVCARCLATARPASIVSRRLLVASHHVRPLSTTLAYREAATSEPKPEATPEANPASPSPATDVEAKTADPSAPPAKKKKKKLSKESGKGKSAPDPETQRQLKVLQGALVALKNVLSTQGVDVSQIPTTHADSTPLALPSEETKSKAKPKVKSRSKSKAEKKADKSEAAPSETTQLDTQPVESPAAESKVAQTERPSRRERRRKQQKENKDVKRKPKSSHRVGPAGDLDAVRSILQKDMAGEAYVIRHVAPGTSSKKKAAPHGGKKKDWTKSVATGNVLPDKVHTAELSLVPIETVQPDVPSLSYGLERVLFNSGVYQLQDPRSRVYNFDPYLSEIMPVKEFDFNALKQYVTSSKDTTLISIAKQNQKKYTGSTSSMTSMLAHFHFLLSKWRNINVSMLSRGFEPESFQYTQIMRAPAATFLHWKDGTYAIDADKEYDTANILSMLGKSMEKLLTLPKDEYERYRRGNSDQITEEERNAEEAFHYTGFQDFMMRSQLDAYDPRMPGTGMFDLKTRAVISIRMDAQGYEKGLGYEIRKRFGQWASFEREYYDMIRSAFLKYSLQVRMGRMDGIFVAFHNTQRIFGFQYIPLTEMDLSLHGTDNRELGDREFKVSLKLLNELLDRATQKWPQQSLRLHFETRASAEQPYMYFFAKPTTPEEIEAVQGASKASVEAFERNILGLVKSAEEEMEIQSGVDDGNKDDLSRVDPPAAEETDSYAIWQEARQMVEEAMGDDEHGVGLVREAIGDALEESGILRARSLIESREYVDTLLEALIGRTPSTQESAITTDPNEEETVDEDELEEQATEQNEHVSDSNYSPTETRSEITEPVTRSSALNQEIGPEAELDSEGQPLEHRTTGDASDSDTRTNSAESEAPLTPGDKSHIDQPVEDVDEVQSHDSQTSSNDSIKEASLVTSDDTTDITKETKEDGSLTRSLKNAEEDYEEVDDDEETSEAELEDDAEGKEFSEDIGSSTLEPLKSLIMRMARRIDEQAVSDTNITSSQDDASKLKEFERILGRLISQSRMDHVEGDSNGDLRSESPPTESISSDSGVTGAAVSDEAADITGTQNEDIQGLADTNRETSDSELLALTLTIKNRVNGAYVDRPRELSEEDDWTVEYEIGEVEQRRAKIIYDKLMQRRRQTLETSNNKDQEWYQMFKGNLPKFTQQGREYRQKEMERAEGKPIHMVGTKGPLEWAEVFGRQPKSSQNSDDGAPLSIMDEPESQVGENKEDTSR
ncbi:mitochondrial protein Pet127-domain-containing protein [Xylaria bambusicola]|uniref:mitochondrial protein Pet127-domain-containing protein n=1 Tax=Xylaria bambusicola TaxID=326684 RepID=UPI00200828FC|nr:mitochondrial protein Pet127-domain-containing protein [Xylaria bambusicola]KAI0525294.1 mitochondrial protein Pet127-domain-containing protein [Xylaria bambusicola]